MRRLKKNTPPIKPFPSHNFRLFHPSTTYLSEPGLVTLQLEISNYLSPPFPYPLVTISKENSKSENQPITVTMQSATRRSLGGMSVICRAGAGSRSATRTAVLEGAIPCIARREYHDNIVEHYENPRNVGSLDKKDKFVGTGLVGAPACGDVMKLQIKVNEDGVITETKFKTFGCGSAIASSSVATEWLKGRSADEGLKIKNTDIAGHLKLPPVKLHCSMLAEDAIKAAIKDLQDKGTLSKSADNEAKVA